MSPIVCSEWRHTLWTNQRRAADASTGPWKLMSASWVSSRGGLTAVSASACSRPLPPHTTRIQLLPGLAAADTSCVTQNSTSVPNERTNERLIKQSDGSVETTPRVTDEGVIDRRMRDRERERERGLRVGRVMVWCVRVIVFVEGQVQVASSLHWLSLQEPCTTHRQTDRQTVHTLKLCWSICWISCRPTTSCSTNPQQVKLVEFEYYVRIYRVGQKKWHLSYNVI